MRDFDLGFWHPMEVTTADVPGVVAARQREAEAHGWTLWPFQSRTTLQQWRDELERTKPGTVRAYCTPVGPEPADEARRVMREYQAPGESTWRAVPEGIHVEAPGASTSAFVVEDVQTARLRPPPTVEWLRSDGSWQVTWFPTRYDQLVKPGKGPSLRRVRAVLTLREPHVVELRA